MLKTHQLSVSLKSRNRLSSERRVGRLSSAAGRTKAPGQRPIGIEFGSFNAPECGTIAQQKKAWDLEIEILGKLLEKERDDKGRFSLNIELFTVNLNLKRYTEAIRIGEQLLEEDKNKNFLFEF